MQVKKTATDWLVVFVVVYSSLFNNWLINDFDHNSLGLVAKVFFFCRVCIEMKYLKCVWLKGELIKDFVHV